MLDRFPPWEISVPKPTLQSVTSITYVDTDGATQTLPPSAYLVDSKSEPGRITPAYGLVWPTTRWQTGAVTIRFVAGYADSASVPACIKQWMLVRLGTLWLNRAEIVVDARVTLVEVPAHFIDRILDSVRVADYGWACE